ncbi:MAG TPA: hypothetical protein VGW38_14665 [Chloroflexota bacterium]|nr:hypothetical protein [Chloroflexota bacterium]
MRIAGRLHILFNVRVLSGLALVLGALITYVERSTSAVTVVDVLFKGNIFDAGVVDLAGTVAGSTGSQLPESTVFTWSTSGAGTSCANVLPDLDVRNQSMAPGQYCVAKVILRNDHPKAVNSWIRLRLVRRTITANAQTEALNDRLRFFMSEYHSGTSRTAEAYQSADCTPTSFRPTAPSTAPNALQSAWTIPNVTDSSQGNRTALASLGPEGKNIGIHPTRTDATTPMLALQLGAGLGLRAGTSVVPTEANMVTDPSAPARYNAFNLIGNDEYTNPRVRDRSIDPNGTRPSGTLEEAEIVDRKNRYFCAAMFFPSDTGVTAANVSGDNAAALGDLTYHLAVTAGQKAKRTVYLGGVVQ